MKVPQYPDLHRVANDKKTGISMPGSVNQRYRNLGEPVKIGHEPGMPDSP